VRLNGELSAKLEVVQLREGLGTGCLSNSRGSCPEGRGPALMTNAYGPGPLSIAPYQGDRPLPLGPGICRFSNPC
jgi:hypothetical protein